MTSSQYDNVWKANNAKKYFKTSIDANLQKYLQNESIKTIVDLGSGDGSVAVDLALQGKTLHAVEISQEGIKKTKEKAEKANVKIHIHHQSMYQKLPFEDHSVDAAIAFQSLNHNTLPEILVLFGQIKRILRPGGLIIIKTANLEAFNFKNLDQDVYAVSLGDYSFNIQLLDSQTYIPIDGPEKGLTHYLFKPKQLKQIFEDIGFSQLHCDILKWHVLAVFQKNISNH